MLLFQTFGRYLTQRFIVSNHFRREAEGGKWNPRACGARS